MKYRFLPFYVFFSVCVVMQAGEHEWDPVTKHEQHENPESEEITAEQRARALEKARTVVEAHPEEYQRFLEQEHTKESKQKSVYFDPTETSSTPLKEGELPSTSAPEHEDVPGYGDDEVPLHKPYGSDDVFSDTPQKSASDTPPNLYATASAPPIEDTDEGIQLTTNDPYAEASAPPIETLNKGWFQRFIDTLNKFLFGKGNLAEAHKAIGNISTKSIELQSHAFEKIAYKIHKLDAEQKQEVFNAYIYKIKEKYVQDLDDLHKQIEEVDPTLKNPAKMSQNELKKYFIHKIDVEKIIIALKRDPSQNQQRLKNLYEVQKLLQQRQQIFENFDNDIKEFTNIAKQHFLSPDEEILFPTHGRLKSYDIRVVRKEPAAASAPEHENLPGYTGKIISNEKNPSYGSTPNDANAPSAPPIE